jgi:hypothetical protein
VNKKAVGFGALLSLVLASGIQAGVISRPLPITNLNEFAGPLRSNISFSEADPSQRMIGDYILMPTSSLFWQIDAITVWSVGSILGDAIGNEFPTVSLYGGVVSTGGATPTFNANLSLLSTGTPDTSYQDTNTVLDSNPNIVHTQVQYVNGEDYEGVGSPGVFYPIWRTRFTNLNWMVPGGAIIDFAAWGINPDANADSLYGYWFTHMSNAADGGILQVSADGAFLVFDTANLSNPGFHANPLVLGLWDKSADVNVIVETTELPEPGFGPAVLASLGMLAMMRRRKR